LAATLPLVLLLVGDICPAEIPRGEANAWVRGLVGAQRQREEALSRYTYDVAERHERLDTQGRVRRREIRRSEVFHVQGRPVRRLVARDGRPLEGRDREREDERVRKLVEAIRAGDVVTEQPGVRLSRILERFDFTEQPAERLEGRCTRVFDFAARPGDFALDRDALLRKLTGRLWVDDEERAVVRLEAWNTAGLKFALGLGASVSTISFGMGFTRMEEGVWLPRSLEAYAEGRRLLFRRFRSRRTTTYSNYRRFDVEVNEKQHP
jgi:hypothetical protein